MSSKKTAKNIWDSKIQYCYRTGKLCAFAGEDNYCNLFTMEIDKISKKEISKCA